MNNYEKFREKYHKEFNRCEECKGEGEIYSDYPDEPDTLVPQDYSTGCETCKGKGFVIPLEFGCEVTDKWHSDVVYGKVMYTSISHVTHMGLVQDGEDTYWKSHTLPKEDVENLGKPVTLQNVLLMLFNLNKVFALRYSLANELRSDHKSPFVDLIDVEGNEVVYRLDLSLQPQEWSDETWGELLALVE